MKKLTRQIELDTRSANDEQRTVPAVVSTATPVDRGGWTEVLLHTNSAIDLSRAPLPLLTGHDARSPNIGVVEGLHLDGDKLRGTVRLGQSKQATELWTDIKAGIVRNVSVGYTVAKWETGDDDDTEIAVRWMPHEVSLVGVAADPQAGLNRNLPRENTMPNETETTDDTNVIPHKRWLAQEQKRRAEVRTAFNRFAETHGDLLDTCLDDPHCTRAMAAERLLNALGSETRTLGDDYQQTTAGGSLSAYDLRESGSRGWGNFHATDTLGEFAAAATDAVLMRGGVRIEKPHPGARDVQRMRLSDIGEVMLRQFGVRTSGMNRDGIVRKALSTRGLISHSTSDFSNLLENIASKALLAGFNEVPSVYRQIARIGSLPDFKTGSRVALSDFTDLEVVYENGEYKYGTFSDLKETLTIQTFGKLFSISRQALVNDDLNALVNVPRGMSAAAARTIDDQVISVITTNAVLNQDGVALFDAATHGNLVTAGAAPSVATLEAGFVAMGAQTGPQGAILDVKPSILLVPNALDATARVLTAALYDPAGATLMVPNPFAGRLTVVSTARLDADSADKWYLLADPNTFDTLEVAFLDGQEAPYLETKDGWSQDGVEYKVRLDCVAGALDFRGMFQNDGA